MILKMANVQFLKFWVNIKYFYFWKNFHLLLLFENKIIKDLISRLFQLKFVGGIIDDRDSKSLPL